MFACGRRGAVLGKEVQSEGGVVRELKDGEVLELLEGPQKVTMKDVSKAKGKLTKDNMHGWVLLQDKHGTSFAAPNANLYVCKTQVAVTDAEGIQDSKVLGKLQEGETFDASTGEVKQDASGISRVQGKATKSGVEGWITTKGNAGTIFAEVVAKNYIVQKEMELCRGFDCAHAMRKIEVGEAFKVVEGPKEEKSAPEARIKVRTATDGVEGWVSKNGLRQWSPEYRVVANSTPLQDTRNTTETTKIVREMMKGEKFEYLEGPFEEGKELRLKGRAKKDGAVGWVSLKDEKGQRRLEN